MILSRTKSLTFLLRHYELTNENVSNFLTNQSKTKTFIDLKVTRNPKPTKNSTRPYLNEIPEIKTKGYDVIGVNWFLRKKRLISSLLYYYLPQSLLISFDLKTRNSPRKGALISIMSEKWINAPKYDFPFAFSSPSCRCVLWESGFKYISQ